jgi:TetR/AcrR family transcriptional regulator, mexJK operon transcriptional repressor
MTDSAVNLVAGRSAQKRQAIMEAAIALFLANGYQRTSMEEVAGLAAVSKQTVYKHFTDKERLFTAIVLTTLDRVADPFRAEIERLSATEDLISDLRLLARAYMKSVMQPPLLQLRRLVIGEANRLPALARTYYERAPERTLAALAGGFGRLADRGLLQLDNPLVAAGHFAFLVLGRALDKSLFWGDQPYTSSQLTAQADAGAVVFLRAYGHS